MLIFVATLTTPDVLAASLPLGYPVSQKTNLNNGGTPVDLGQTNGFFNLLSQYIVWINTGGQFTFDQNMAINGGYNQGAVLYSAKAQKYLVSLVNPHIA